MINTKNIINYIYSVSYMKIMNIYAYKIISTYLSYKNLSLNPNKRKIM